MNLLVSLDPALLIAFRTADTTLDQIFIQTKD